MTKDSLIRLTLIGALVISGLSFNPSLDAGTRAMQQQGNLHDRAVHSGGRLAEGFMAERATIYPNVTELARRSSAIVIGRAAHRRDHLTSDGNSITTDVSVVVQEVVKGNMRTGSVVLVSLPGGAHRFEDGVTAFLYAKNYRPAQNGKTYVFFLDRRGPVSRGYELTGGIQGQFELDFASGKVVTGDTVLIDPVVHQQGNQLIKSFLVELHTAAR